MPKVTQIVTYISFIVLALIILVTSFYNQSISQTAEKLGLATPSPISGNQNPVEILVPSHSNFTLTDPGILPNNFFYPTKMIRDRIFLVLTFNPEAKARLLFHYSNTRMSAADKLIQQGDTNLAISTAIKGQAYLFQAIKHSQDISKHNQLTWYDSLRLALLKHEEIIEKLRFVAKDQSRQQADQLWDQLEFYRLEVTSLSGVPFNYLRPEDIIVTQDLEPYL